MAIVAQANTSTYIQGCVDYYAYESGGNIKVDVYFKMRRTNSYSGTTYSTTAVPHICISGDPANFGYTGSAGVYVYGGQQNQWQSIYSASRTFDASRSGDTIYVGWKVDNDNSGYLAGSAVAAITLPTVYTAPSTPSVSISEIYTNGAKFNVSISNYGNPSSTSGRYIEAAILGQNSYGASYRYATVSNTTSAIITVNNSSPVSPSGWTIYPNTQYYYGGYATNTQKASYTVTGTFITLPATPSASLSVTGQTTATLTVTAPSQGTASTLTVYYKLNSGSYANGGTISQGASKTISLSGLTAGTNYSATVYLSNSSGSSGTVTTNTVTTYKAPQGLSSSVDTIYTNGAKINIGVSNYGIPSSQAGRYIQGVISANNSISSDDWRSSSQTNVTSATVTITNNSISANTIYYYGTYAYNGVISTNSMGGSFITLPKVTSVTSSNIAATTATITINIPSQGSAATLTGYYKINSGTAVSVGTVTQGSSKTVNLTGLTPSTTYTITAYISNSSGSSSTVTTAFTTKASAYCSVNGQAKRVSKMYCSVNGQAKQVVKAYCSVNGQTKRIL